MPRIKAGTGKTAAVETARGVDEYLGICSTCNHASGCAHRIKNAGVAIWDCEDYDDYVRLNGTFVGGEPDPVGAPVRSRPRDDGAVLVEHRGLCKNCAKREYCAFPRPEGGVWHCEEYD